MNLATSHTHSLANRSPKPPSEAESMSFYEKVGIPGLVHTLEDCLGYTGPEFPEMSGLPGGVSHFNAYDAKCFIEKAPKWPVISPELQLMCLFSVWALAGRSLSITLGQLNIPPDPSAALELLVHVSQRGWTSDACRVPGTCRGSYQGDFEQCARSVFLAAYPEILDRTLAPLDEKRTACLIQDTHALEKLLGNSVAALVSAYLSSAQGTLAS
jgi:hypothetical protein